MMNSTLHKDSRKIRLGAKLALCAACAGVALSPGHAQTTKPKTLRIAYATAFDRVDPASSGFASNYMPLSFAFEGLTAVDIANRVIPAAAASWSSNATLTEFVFNLRPGLKYSDGSMLNAKRFEYAIMRYFDPATQGFNTLPYYIIDGVEDWAKASEALAAEKDAGKQKAHKDAAIAAAAKLRQNVRALDGAGKPCASYAQTDCLTLRVTLKSPQVELPYLLGGIAFAPVKEEIVAKDPDWWKRTRAWVGNGPYKLTSMAIRAVKPFGNAGVFQYAPSATYHGKKPAINLALQIKMDGDALIADYQAGKLDMLGLTAGPTWSQQVAKIPPAEIITNPSTCKVALAFRTINKPFDDVKVRQAFAAGFDRAAYAKRDFWGPTAVDPTWLPQGVVGAIANETRFTYSPEAARALLAESSYKTVDALPPVVIPHLSADLDPNDKVIAEFFGNAFQTTFPGLKVNYQEIKTIEAFYDVRDDVKNPASLWQMSWCGSRPDDLLGEYFATNKRGWLNSRWSNAAFDTITAKMALEPDFDKKAALAREAHELLINEQPYLFIGTSRNVVLVKPTVVVGKPSISDLWVGDFDEAGWSLK
jgi:oligopeptide transport system substrate-binding protein